MNEHTAMTATAGIDLGDRRSHYVVLDASGEIVDEGGIASTLRGVARRFEGRAPMRVVVEAGTHSGWVARALEGYGHEVLVANPRRVALIYGGPDKSDEVDAEALARLARFDPRLLRPVTPRSEQTQADRTEIRSRTALLRARTQLINHIRGSVKPLGTRIAACSPGAFPKRAREVLPSSLQAALEPVLEVIESLTERIRASEKRLEQMADERYPETRHLRAVPGVGALVALTYVFAIEDPERFAKSRSVGSFLGLRPRRAQSGTRDPQLRITKAGDGEARRHLVLAAQYILGPHGPDCDLKRFGLRIAERGGKAAKKRAVIAVARKLAVLLHQLWVTGKPYEPHRSQPPTAA